MMDAKRTQPARTSREARASERARPIRLSKTKSRSVALCVTLLTILWAARFGLRRAAPLQDAQVPEALQPVNKTDHTFLLALPALPIDLAHRTAVAHKGVWLHVVTSDGAVLVLRRSPTMATCPGRLSIIGEHHMRAETDEACAR